MLKHSKITALVLTACLAVSLLLPGTAAAFEAGVSVEAPRYGNSTPLEDSESAYTVRQLHDGAMILKYNGSLTKLILPSEIGGEPVAYIAVNAFTDTAVEYVRIPSTVKRIAPGAFSRADKLTAFDVDSANETFASAGGVLYNKTKTRLIAFPGGLDGEFTVPNGVTDIASRAFEYCYRLTAIDMYNTVTTIGSQAFDHCWNVARFRLSDALKTIGAKAFAYCDEYTEVHVPATVTSIGADAFLGMDGSDDTRMYRFYNGVYVVKGSYAETYFKSIGITPTLTCAGQKVLRYEARSATNVPLGITVYDTAGKWPAGKIVTVTASSLPAADYDPLITDSSFTASAYYTVSLKANGAAFTTSGNKMTLYFYKLPAGMIGNTAHIYRISGSTATLLQRSGGLDKVCTDVTSLETFGITGNSDFTVKGDVNGDGLHTLEDVYLTLCAASGTVKLTASQTAVADLNGDKKVTTADARALLRYVAGVSKSPA